MAAFHLLDSLSELSSLAETTGHRARTPSPASSESSRSMSPSPEQIKRSAEVAQATPALPTVTSDPISVPAAKSTKAERKRLRRQRARAAQRQKKAASIEACRHARNKAAMDDDGFSLSALDFFGSPSSPSPASLKEKLLSCPDDMPSQLPPEPQEGNTEYKLKLVDPTAQRFEHLVTQMKWRLAEGGGEAVYEIGVADDGSLTGLSEVELEGSLRTLEDMARAVGAHTKILRSREGVNGHGRVAEVHVRRVPDDQQYLDLRVGFVGPANAGKSSLLGVLTSGELDNGRGKARLNLFRHHHEIKSGRTSSLR